MRAAEIRARRLLYPSDKLDGPNWARVRHGDKILGSAG